MGVELTNTIKTNYGYILLNINYSLTPVKTLLSILLLACVSGLHAQTTIELKDVASHIGDTVQVKGKMFGVKYLEASKNTPTFINVLQFLVF